MLKKTLIVIFLGLCFGANDLNFNVKSNSTEKPRWMVDSFEGIREKISKYALPGGIVGISIKDLSSGETFSLNGGMMFHPASVIKIPVMVEAFRQAEKGIISLDDQLTLKQYNKIPGSGSLQYLKNGSRFTVLRLIDLMITDSDNTATHMLVQKLGMGNINYCMRRYGIYKTVIKDPTMLVKEEGKHNITCPDDMLRLLDKMYKGQLVTPLASEKMLAIMKAQRHKWGLARFLPNVVIANKTGSLDFVRNDVGIVLDEDKPYIISIFSKHLPSNRYGSVMVGELSRIIYDIRKHELFSKANLASNG